MEMSNRRDRAFGISVPAPVGNEPITLVEGASKFAQTLIDAVREPLLIVDGDLRVVAANSPFCSLFEVARQDLQGRPVRALGEGQLNGQKLKTLFENVLPRQPAIEAYEVEVVFPEAGHRTLLISSREIPDQQTARRLVVLAVEDITERRAAERTTADLLHQKEILVREMQHRVGNSLQIIASLLLLKARTVQSEETRIHLQEAHRRVLCVAAVQWQLYASQLGERMELAPYLSRLCESLAASMIDEDSFISLEVRAGRGSVTPAEAASIGLIVTELVINAIKHAFVGRPTGSIVVTCDVASAGWRLAVSDNGIGRPKDHPGRTIPGLGTGIVEALARQLNARVETSIMSGGTMVSIIQRTSEQ
jgi:PAS domain S-box-containing protein